MLAVDDVNAPVAVRFLVDRFPQIDGRIQDAYTLIGTTKERFPATEKEQRALRRRLPVLDSNP